MINKIFGSSKKIVDNSKKKFKISFLEKNHVDSVVLFSNSAYRAAEKGGKQLAQKIKLPNGEENAEKYKIVVKDKADNQEHNYKIKLWKETYSDTPQWAPNQVINCVREEKL